MNRGNVSERRHEPPQVGVTSVILALEPAREHGRRRLWLPLVRRVREPFL
ncbi:MAG: NUDIX hydrolase, partial [Bifidobacterium pseudolongum]|nr:NUDIX hydrolase [Bifidobacterium pseudolongum]